MTHGLEFKWVIFSDFKNFNGKHKVFLGKAKPGLYFFTGKNLVEPQLGANGVGKSTIFDAVFWCFFGKTIKDGRPADAVVPWSDKKAAPSATVRFYRDGLQMSLTRTRKPNRLFVTVNDDKKIVEKEIQQTEVPQLLGMNEETFRRTILIGQFGTMFLDLKPEAQSAMFNDALDLDRWLRAAKLAGTNATELEGTLAQVKSHQERLAGRLEAARAARTNAKAGEAVWEADNAKALKRHKAAVQAAQEALDELDAHPEAKPATAEKLRTKRKAAKEALAALTEAKDRAQRLERTADRAETACVAEIRTAKAKLAQLKAAAQDKECPTCGQTVTGKHLKTELTEQQGNIDALELALNGFEENRALAQAEVEKALELEATKEYEIENLAEQILEAEKAYSKWQGQREAADLQLKNAQKVLRAAEKVENPHTATVASLLVDINKLKEDIATGKDVVATTEAAAGRYRYWVNAFKEIRLSLIDEVLMELQVASTAHAERLGMVDWEIKFQTERETKAGDTSYGFTVLLYPPGQKEPVRWESYSGGEDRRWQLAVTFGLSEVLLARAGLTSNLEVLDEPAQHMSPEGVESLLEALADRAIEQGKTIFYVDHSSLDRGYFEDVLTVVRTKEGSTIQ